MKTDAEKINVGDLLGSAPIPPPPVEGDIGPLCRLRTLLDRASPAQIENLEKLTNAELLGRWLKALTFTEIHQLRAEIKAKKEGV